MKIAIFDTHRFERDTLEGTLREFPGHSLTFLEPRLSPQTAPLAQGHEVVCSFVNDQLGAETIQTLSKLGIRLIALRSAGFNHVDLAAAERAGIAVVRVPEYSPFAVAEHAVCLLLALDRKIHRAYNRVREANFSLDGLVGFDLHGRTVGVVGTGRIGRAFARIMTGFGCRVLAYDKFPDPSLERELGVHYVPLERIYREADVISLHVPLKPETSQLLNAQAFALMKPGVVVINTGRGKLIDTKALIDALKAGRVGAAGLDVYEEEEAVFFQDLSEKPLQDDVLARLLTFPNVLITSHQAFLTQDALLNIAHTTLENIDDFSAGRPLKNAVRAESHVVPAS